MRPVPRRRRRAGSADRQAARRARREAAPEPGWSSPAAGRRGAFQAPGWSAPPAGRPVALPVEFLAEFRDGPAADRPRQAAQPVAAVERWEPGPNAQAAQPRAVRPPAAAGSDGSVRQPAEAAVVPQGAAAPSALLPVEAAEVACEQAAPQQEAPVVPDATAAGRSEPAGRHAVQPQAAVEAPRAAELDVALRPAVAVAVAAHAVQAPGVAARQGAVEAAEVQEAVAPDGAARRRAPAPGRAVAAAPAAVHAVAASASRPGRLRLAPGPRPAVRPAQRMRSLPIAPPTMRSSQAAQDEVCSCRIVSPEMISDKSRRDQQICVRPECGAVQMRRPIYFAACARPRRPHSCRIQC